VYYKNNPFFRLLLRRGAKQKRIVNLLVIKTTNEPIRKEAKPLAFGQKGVKKNKVGEKGTSSMK
jgi:hypothetical protein